VAPFVWVTGFHDLVSGTSFRCFLGGVWDFFTSSNLAQLHKCRAKHLNFSNSASQKKGDVDPNFSVFMNQEKRCFTIPILSFLMKLRGNYPPMPSITQKKNGLFLFFSFFLCPPPDPVSLLSTSSLASLLHLSRHRFFSLASVRRATSLRVDGRIGSAGTRV
jgi:hypothetical protein